MSNDCYFLFPEYVSIVSFFRVDFLINVVSMFTIFLENVKWRISNVENDLSFVVIC